VFVTDSKLGPGACQLTPLMHWFCVPQTVACKPAWKVEGTW